MTQATYHIATTADAADVGRVLSRSYPALLALDYTPDELDHLLPVMTTAQPDLLSCGTYWIARVDGKAAAVGGCTVVAPGTGAIEPGVAHVRHVGTDPGYLRLGLARALMGRAMDQMRALGVGRLTCLSTRTGVPFYAALGFVAIQSVEVPLAKGVTFSAVEMSMPLSSV